MVMRIDVVMRSLVEGTTKVEYMYDEELALLVKDYTRGAGANDPVLATPYEGALTATYGYPDGTWEAVDIMELEIRESSGLPDVHMHGRNSSIRAGSNSGTFESWQMRVNKDRDSMTVWHAEQCPGTTPSLGVAINYGADE
tara:strand:- start:583 stop:1005 length:423 start_codon:yes stop_codon:yes gene_type:complete